MNKKELDPNNLEQNEDWEGNNAAFTCPHCGKVFIVSWLIHKKSKNPPEAKRPCPKCGKSIGHVSKKGRKDGGTARIEWN